MNAYKSNSAQNIVYIDHSTSGIGIQPSQSSSDPISLANLMREITMIISLPDITIDSVEKSRKEEENTNL